MAFSLATWLQPAVAKPSVAISATRAVRDENFHIAQSPPCNPCRADARRRRRAFEPPTEVPSGPV